MGTYGNKAFVILESIEVPVRATTAIWGAFADITIYLFLSNKLMF